MLAPLPVDETLADLIAALRQSASAVLIAPPGAGKTTRVPPALLDAGLAGDRDVVVLEPRRLAARMAAQRVAEERGERVGETVGYEVRFDRAVGQRTRIRFVTEGVLTRQLVSEPALARVGVVVIDEFHERHLHGDLALALLRRLQRASRPELRLVVMSATLAPGPVSEFLGRCPVIESAGRQYPVEVEYAPAADDRPLERRVAAAVRQALRPDQDGGDVLVFLPGAAEIRAAMTACTEDGLTDLSQRADLLPLHGDLPAAEQDRAVRPGPRRKVVFATNVAESSITIEGVTRVIDSGLARVARHSPWSGIATLRVEPVSQASAAQRAGRAGRTAPGRCVRLYTRHDHDGRPAYDVPEVARADLAEAALWLHALGVRDLAGFSWYECPPEAALRAAGELLRRLGAIAADGAMTDSITDSVTDSITDLGRRMLRMPVHPRQARMLIEAEARGAGREGCVLAALVGERELRLERRTSLSGAGRGPARAHVSAPSDLIEDLERFEDVRRAGLRPERIRAAGLDVAAVMAVDRARRQLERIARQEAAGPARPSATPEELDEALLVATLAGYPDRVARRRRPGSDELVLAGGGSARLAAGSAVVEAPFLVAVDAREADDRQGRGRGVVVHRASAVDPAWLLDLFLDRIQESDELQWNGERERVERVARLAYDGLTIDEQRDVAGAQRDPVRAAEILAEAALAAGVERFCDRAELDAWRHRVAFVAGAVGEAGVPVPGDDDVTAALRALCVGCASFDELRQRSLLGALRGLLPDDARASIERMAPQFVSLAGRRRVPVHYEADRPPWIESRLQDFFGMTQGPSVAGGRVPLTLHLLAPNQRAVQVTSDLAGFWTRHYPALRKQLMRRYPRHAWPEDPLRAAPPAR